MNIFRHEMKAYRKSLLIWIGSLTAVMVFYMSILPGMAKDAEGIMEIFKNYPPELIEGLGMQLESLTSTLGFYAYMMNFLLFVGAIQGMNLGLSVVSKETRMKTADFLLTKPVKRTEIFLAKFLSGKGNLLLTNIAFVGASLLVASVFKSTDYEVGSLILLALTMFLIQFFFFTFGLCVSIVFKKMKNVVGLSIGIVAFFYVFSIFGTIVGEDLIRYLTPFQYFQLNEIAENGVYDWGFFTLCIGLSLCFTIVAFVTYQKKDI